MDETAKSATRFPGIVSDRERIDVLERENRLLKKNIESLRTRSHATHELPHAGDEQLRHLREANQHLVLAAFGAQDMQTSAEAVNRRQTVFLSMLAHELRTPLASVSAATSVLERLGIAGQPMPELTAILRRQVSHLVRLVDDLLDASRISSGKISLRPHPVTLDEIIGSAVETAQPFFDARGQELQLNLSTAPVVLNGDLVRLAQLFSNLLINASKFSAKNGRVVLSAIVHASTVAVSVVDDGVGIAHELQPHIFDLFTQGDQSSEHASGGLGVGLSLVRTIAEMHGGTVTVESKGSNCGSEFVVVLPLPKQLSPPALP